MGLIDRIKAVVEKKIHGEQGYSSGDAECGYRDCARDILSFLNTLQIKEVDLEKEVEDWVKIGPHTSYPWCTIPDAIRITAEHFFELGLKAQKGE